MSSKISDELDEQSPAPDGAVRDVAGIVGSNLKRLRKANGYSLERLAELSKVSRAMLGQIETGKSVPTIGVLWKIADALGVPLTGLIAVDGVSSVSVLRRSQTATYVSADGRVIRRPLSAPGWLRSVEFFELAIDAGRGEPLDPQPPGSRQSLVVTKGQLSITVGDEPAAVLAEGDAIQFEADVPCLIVNQSDEVGVAYVVVSSGAGTGA